MHVQRTCLGPCPVGEGLHIGILMTAVHWQMGESMCVDEWVDEHMR